jgi:autotransporter translocation and assembly factor TamB
LKADIQLTKAEMNLREFETDLARTIHIVGGETKGDLVVVGRGEKEEESYYTTLKMDLDVRLPASATWVRGNGLESEITGALRLQKAINAPLRLYGGLQALRGSYTFQGNKLTIVDGELAFFGSPQPDPILKIVCQKEVKDVTIRANVNGPLSQPKFTLSSVPAMNQVDVLSYLLFGHPAGDLNSKQTSQLQNGAASWLGSQTSRVLKSVFGNTVLTPDTFQYHNGGDKKGDGAVIEIGKYVTPDLYVTYEKGVNGEKENQVQLEYRLNRHLSVQTQVGGADRSGVDVFWRYDFGK